MAGELIVPAFHKLRAMDIGALLAGGILEVAVLKKPRAGIIPTGTEIVEAGSPMEKGKIIDSNTRMFEALIKEYGGEPARYAPVPDDYAVIKAA
ncbi:molybdopterin-binding protein, partial [Eubacterium callanderi]|uniref:molybdopterin-binding protein n=1 Tax=Eubacterium callanderi TaxID=53442 RepID=UPI00210DF929|nr:molybdopterin-binding protein [Eubacterium callanderi]